MNSSTKKPVLIIGGASDIARATAVALARAGHPIYLTARDGVSRLADDVADLRLRFSIEAEAWDLDILETDKFEPFLDALPVRPGVVVCVVGLLGDQDAARHSPKQADAIMRTNYVAPALLLGIIADRMEAADGGTIVGISSVAGDRGRGSNYVYGSAKAGFSEFLSGLRNRLAPGGKVHVSTVKPGFVATKMTAGMDLPGALTAQPDEVANAIVRAVDKSRDVVYVRPIWRLIMTVIKFIPEFIFKKLKL